MDFSLSEEQRAIHSAAESVFGPRSAASVGHQAPPGSAESFDSEAWADMARADLLGIAVGEEFGGSGLGLLEVCALLWAQGRHLIRVPAGPALAVAAPAIERFGSGALRESVLARVVTGDCVLSTALIEAGAHDPADVGVSARPGPAGTWLVTGEKICVPYAGLAERILTPVRIPDSGIAVAAIDPGSAGVRLTPQQATHGEPVYQVGFDDAVIDEGDLLGRGAEERAEAFSWVLQRSTVTVCALQLGVAEQILAMTTSHVRERRQFGRPLGAFQGVALRLADAYLAVECIRNSMWQAAWALSDGRDAAQAVRLAKYWAAESGQRLAVIGQHLHGGIGVDTEYPLHRYTLWAKSQELSLGSAHPMLDQIGRHLADAGTAAVGPPPGDPYRPSGVEPAEMS
ncbi:acyl-CoA dehydrogenase family protein [Streptosporangium sp. CA-115845]|uniref:acyl-CoA dehydrogenase family protein n=1 Tax=Streptosporangium sp. CA-115845 TaxID=3240071 RepID=UPI003D8FAA3A